MPRMRIAVGTWVAMTLLLLGSPLASQVPHYDVRAVIDPAGERLRAEVSVTFVATEEVSRVEYWLNQGLELESAEGTVPVLSVERDSAGLGGMRWSAESDLVRIELARPIRPGERVTVTLRYGGVMAPNSWGVNVLGEEWFELGLYSGWYPLMGEDARFTYSLEARLPAPYRATGLGAISREESGGDAVYRVEQVTPVNDLVLAGSRGLETEVVRHGEFAIRLSHVTLTPRQVNRVASDAADILGRFGAWFGPSSPGELEFLFAPRERGGGYARPGLVVMQLDADTDLEAPGSLRYLAHEIGHLWWAGAPTSTWEDWLNESFAEYAALMLLRERVGPGEVERRIREYRKAADGTPPIRGLDRDHEDAFRVLYRKGPVLLHDLEARIGLDRFLALLQALRRDEVDSTAGLLALLAHLSSPADRDWLDAALDCSD